MNLSGFATAVWTVAALAACNPAAEVTAPGEDIAEPQEAARPSEEVSRASEARAPSSAASSEKIPAWQAPDHYGFDLVSSCGERSLLGDFRITVEDGAISHLEALDEQAQRIVDDPELRETVPTLSGLLDEARAAQDQGADVVEVTVDPADGHPTAINIDWQLNATDDEACYAVSNYTTAP